VYQTAVRAPINADGSSNWPAKRGVIPVQFNLSTATAVVTTTATTVGAFVFESIWSDGTDPDETTTNDYSFVSFTPSSPMTFNEITTLSSVYAFTLGDCHGGSLRWSVRTSSTQSLFIYYGDEPNTTDCTTNSQSGINMIGLSDLRYDTSQYVGGTFYDTYAHAQTLIGTTPIVRASLVLDGGWAGDQGLTLTSATVNDNIFTPLAPGTTSTTTTVTGDFAPTCTLPEAGLRWAKNDATPTGAINEAASIQPRDTGQYYRQVDCKYIYNLDVTSLTGVGTYTVWVLIDGEYIQAPATFDLR
jgi:hypothetical protein